MTRVGFVGLGSQGGPMARRIADAGFPTTLWGRRPETVASFAGTPAASAANLAELGAASDILCVCVVDDADVDQVLRGPEGALTAMVPGSVVVVHSTVRPDTCLRLQADHPGLHLVDAPVSGGGHKAAAGELVVMAGGTPDDIEQCRPVFETYGDPVLHVGPLGTGQLVKLLNNTAFAAQLAVAAEVFELADAHGIDRAAVATVLGCGSGRSYAADVVAGSGYALDGLAAVAGALLAKDVGILADHAAPERSALLAAADAALARMGVPRPTHGPDDEPGNQDHRRDRA